MERPAFDRLLTDSLPVIYSAAKSYASKSGRLHEWEDIAQTAILKMLRYAHTYDPAKGEIRPWICVVIANTIKDSIISDSALPDMEEFNDFIIDQTPAASEYDIEAKLQADYITAYLNEETRLYVEGYTYVEIAALRGFRSKSTAYDRIGKCADHLSRILGRPHTKARRQRNVPKVPA